MSPRSLYNPIRTSDMMRRRRADGAAAHDAVGDGAAEAHGGAVDAAGAEQMAAGAEQMAAGAGQMAAASAGQMAAASAVQDRRWLALSRWQLALCLCVCTHPSSTGHG